MNHQPDERLDAYLWDPAAPPDDSVAEIERRLVSARFDPAAHPLFPQAPRIGHSLARRRAATSWMRPLAWAAAIVLVAGAGFGVWRWSWPDGRAWPVRTAAGTDERLRVGSTLKTDAAEGALVQIARIGTMQVEGKTVVTLRSTASNRHRLVLEEGTVRIRVWAPPFSVTFRTPAGEVSDLGCEFDLTVAGETSYLRVRSGWGQLENVYGETLVPAGASSVMTAGIRPAVPVFDDAAPGFMEAVRDHERSPQDAEPVRRIVALARSRDVFTLLRLVQRRSPAAVELTSRAAQLLPPPAGVDLARVAAADPHSLDRWTAELRLPSPKGTWFWNWRDGLPWFSKEVR